MIMDQHDISQKRAEPRTGRFAMTSGAAAPACCNVASHALCTWGTAGNGKGRLMGGAYPDVDPLNTAWVGV